MREDKNTVHNNPLEYVPVIEDFNAGLAYILGVFSVARNGQFVEKRQLKQEFESIKEHLKTESIRVSDGNSYIQNTNKYQSLLQIFNYLKFTDLEDLRIFAKYPVAVRAKISQYGVGTEAVLKEVCEIFDIPYCQIDAQIGSFSGDYATFDGFFDSIDSEYRKETGYTDHRGSSHSGNKLKAYLEAEGVYNARTLKRFLQKTRSAADRLQNLHGRGEGLESLLQECKRSVLGGM